MPSATKVQTGYLEAVNPFSLAPGSASAPAVTFTDNSSTGMFSPSTGVLAFSTGSTQNALTILADGNVGIREINPSYSLSINTSGGGAGSVNGMMLMAPNLADGNRHIFRFGKIIDNNTCVNFEYKYNDLNLSNLSVHHFGDAFGSALNVKKGGLVGIGTDNASEKLDVVGNIKLTGQIFGPSTLIIDPSVVGDDTGTVEIKGNLTVQGTTTTINSTTLNINDKNIVLADGTSTLANLDTAGIDFGTTSVKIRYYYNGGTNSGLSIEGTNVGIGTTNPLEKLDVRGNLVVGGSTSSNYIAFQGTTGDLPGSGRSFHSYIGERIYGGTEQSELLILKDNDGPTSAGPDRVRIVGSNIRFDTYSINNTTNANFEEAATNANNTLAVLINSVGDVGIGTGAPSSKLSIYGSSVDDVARLDLFNGGDESGTAAKNEVIRFGRPDQSSSTYYNSIWSATGSGSESSHYLRFYLNQGNVSTTDQIMIMQLTANKKVGINTTTPEASLQVSNSLQFDKTNANQTAGLLVDANGSNTTGDGEYGAGISFSRIDSTRVAASIASVQTSVDARTMGLAFFTHPTATFDNIVEEQVRITHDGNLGIANTNPQRKLDVGTSSLDSIPMRLMCKAETYALSSSSRQQYTPSGTVTEIVGSTPTSGNGGTLIDIQAYRSSGAGQNIFLGAVNNGNVVSGADFVLGRRTGTTSWAESLRVNSTGDVGIGTTNPREKLSISVDTLNYISGDTTTISSIYLGPGGGISRNTEHVLGKSSLQSGLVVIRNNHSRTISPVTTIGLTEFIKDTTFGSWQITSNVNSFTFSADNYCLQIFGYYYAPEDGLYEFGADGDDAVDVFLDGKLVGCFYNGHGPSGSYTGGVASNSGNIVYQRTGSIFLNRGYHRIVARQQEIAGGDEISLWHKIPSGAWEKIPASYFYHDGTDLIRSLSGGCAVLGTFSATSTKNFRIAHPLEELSETHDLIHSSIEGPSADLMYRGKVTLVDGYAEVNIDEHSKMTEGTFIALCKNIQCFTTNETGWTNVKGTVVGNILKIYSQESTEDTISWMVIGQRQDKDVLESPATDNNGDLIVEPLRE